MQANYRIGGLAIALIISQFSSAALAHDEPDVAQFADFDYNGEVKVTIRNETTLPITLSGVPVNEDTCEVNFQFDGKRSSCQLLKCNAKCCILLINIM